MKPCTIFWSVEQAKGLEYVMKHIEKWTGKRCVAAKLYREALAGVSGVRLPREAVAVRAVSHIFGVFVQNRDAVAKKMQEAGVGVGIHYPIPVHLQKCFAELGHQPGDFPVAEQIGAEELSLPIYPEITPDQIQTVVNALAAAL